MVPLLRQVRQRLQPDRLLGRRPPDPEDGKNLNVGAKLKMSRSHSPRPAGLVVVEAVEHGVAEVLLRRGRRGHHGVRADLPHVHLQEITNLLISNILPN